MSTSTTSSAPASSPTSNGGGSGGGSSGPTSSPLLFFVALGFGVVFTNLWIIVGVKYCFRYNQRNRQLRNEENGEGVDMATMPRAHRRRREKKLMTMDEVNERFPLVKYKAWRASRAAEGLPTAGGVAATTSRPVSMKAPSVKDGTTKEEVETIRESQDGGPVDKTVTADTTPPQTSIETPEKTNIEPKPETNAARPSTAQSKPPGENQIAKIDTADHDEDDDDEQIQTALPAEMLGDPGDSCAICIDNIDDDDDVRGLTCGHAFHAHCVDPWLTSRRACCPLCKADYYVPKPRPEGADASAETERQGRRGRGGVNMPQSPPYALMGSGHRRPRMILPGRFMTIVYSPNDRYGFPQVQREARPSNGRQFSGNGAAAEAAPGAPNAAGNTNNTGSNGGIGSRIRNIRLPRPSAPSVPSLSNPFRRNNPNPTNPSAGTSDPSPSQLEAGQAERSQ
ncbi:MAG: hypothetical protein Q9160_002008 [Pyrenula sp. 1 TL-2023]